MLSRILIILICLPVFAHADILLDIKSQNRVRILKVVEAFQTEIIEQMRQGKIVESCMKIADAHSASIELKVMSKKSTLVLESNLHSAKVDCSNLDIVKLDEMYLSKIARHLQGAQEEFKNL